MQNIESQFIALTSQIREIGQKMRSKTDELSNTINTFNSKLDELNSQTQSTMLANQTQENGTPEEHSQIKIEYSTEVSNNLPTHCIVQEEVNDLPQSTNTRDDVSLKSENTMSEFAVNGSNSGNPVKILEYDAYYGKVVLLELVDQDLKFISFYPNTQAQEEIRAAEIEKMKAIFDKQGKIDKRLTIKSTDVKNFPKMIGDYFANFLAKHHKIGTVKKVLKDKSSCSKLSEYLDGTSKIENVSTKACIRMFFQFIWQMNFDKIDQSRVGNSVLKTCYKLIFSYVKSVIEALGEWGLDDKINWMHIEKFWPTLELRIKTEN